MADLPNTYTCLADLLILVIHKTIVTSQNRIHDSVLSGDQLESLWHMLFTCITNISPYLTRICLAASVKLVNLFQVLSLPKFLLDSPDNHRYLFYLIEIFNNVVQYQFSGNSSLVYCVLKRSYLFQELNQLNIEFPNDKLTFPNREWFLSWKSRIQLQTILRMIDHLAPKLNLISNEYFIFIFY